MCPLTKESVVLFSRRSFNKLLIGLGLVSVPTVVTAKPQKKAPVDDLLVLMPTPVSQPVIVGRWLQTLGTTTLHGHPAEIGIAVLENGFGLKEFDHSQNYQWSNQKNFRRFGGKVVVLRCEKPADKKDLCDHPACPCRRMPLNTDLKLFGTTPESVELPADADIYKFYRPMPCTKHGIEGYTMFCHATDKQPACYECGTDCYLKRHPNKQNKHLFGE